MRVFELTSRIAKANESIEEARLLEIKDRVAIEGRFIEALREVLEWSGENAGAFDDYIHGIRAARCDEEDTLRRETARIIRYWERERDQASLELDTLVAVLGRGT